MLTGQVCHRAILQTRDCAVWAQRQGYSVPGYVSLSSSFALSLSLSLALSLSLSRTLSHPVPNPCPTPATGLRRTTTRSAGPFSFYSHLLLHLLLTYSFLTRHPRTPLRTPPASGHPPHSAPSFRLSFRLTYLIRVYPLASASLYRTLTPVLTHRTPTGPPIRTRSLSI